MLSPFYIYGARTACYTVKLAEPPPPKGMSAEEWDRILQKGPKRKYSAKTATMAPAMSHFLQRAGISAGIDAAVGAAIAPRPEDRPRMALYSALASVPVAAAEHIPDAFRYLKETKPAFASLMRRIRL